MARIDGTAVAQGERNHIRVTPYSQRPEVTVQVTNQYDDLFNTAAVDLTVEAAQALVSDLLDFINKTKGA